MFTSADVRAVDGSLPLPSGLEDSDIYQWAKPRKDGILNKRARFALVPVSAGTT